VKIALASLLANQFRDLDAPVFLVRAAFPAGPAALNLISDAKAPLPPTEPEGWYEPALKPRENDVLILKRHWGAFYGTELDLQLMRRAYRDDRNRWNSDQFRRRVDCSQRL